MTINCKDFKDKVTPFIDNEIEKENRSSVEKHASLCSDCNLDLVIEKKVKKVIQDQTPLESAPDELKSTIFKKLSHRLFLFRVKELFNSIIKKPVYSLSFGLGLTFLIYAAFFNKSNDFVSANFSNNVFAQSIVNFNAVKNHKYPSKTILNSNQEAVKGFLISNGFKSPIFPKTKWKLIGAGLNKLNEIIIAHLIYQSDKDIVYIFQAPCSAIIEDKKLFLSESLLENVINKDFEIVETDSCNALLSIIDGTFASFVMDRKSSILMADLLNSFEYR
ncbi:MAG: hypothetical protein FJ213_02620 [Ignavibacteria bacterium]|nr:hypothetical protein [Ignavibacteria bacterium]